MLSKVLKLFLGWNGGKRRFNSQPAIWLRGGSRVIFFVLILSLPGSITLRPLDLSPAGSYIIQGADLQALEAAVLSAGGRISSKLAIIQGVAAELPAGAASQLARNRAVSQLMPNSRVEAVSTGSLEQGGKISPDTDYPSVVGANHVWSAGITGNGVTVAVIDSGLAPLPGLANGPSGTRILGWVDLVDVKKKTSPIDPFGHGTHVAAIIANSDRLADGSWSGVAPGVKLVGVRVLNSEGFGSYESVINGIQWVIANKDVYNIRVINLSLVAPVLSPYWADPLNQAVMQAWKAGIVVVASAGNEGPGPQTVMAPGNNPYIITVGAFTDAYTPYDWSDDYIAPFSAAGPTQDGFIKPDLVAPGAHMVSLMLQSSKLAQSYQANRIGSQYFSMAGTSQAAAVVSGVVALMLSADPDLTPDEVKFRLLSTAFPWQDPATGKALYSIWQQGAGRVNAVDAALSMEASGKANAGMDISADLDGSEHYAGYSYFDPESGLYRLREPADGINDSTYGTWSGTYGTWSGTYGTWSGTYGTWSGTYGTWSGTYGTWSGTYGTWSGTYGTWSGTYGTWSGTYGTWSGTYGTWSGSTISTCRWVNEP